MKQLFFVLLAGILSLQVFAQNRPVSANDTLLVHTSAQCPMCKERIEKALAFEKGVVNSLLDLETRLATVVYNPRRTTPDKIRKAISSVGYDADTVAASPRAYEKLPPCCKKPDDPAHRKHGGD